jgi:signal transduction histidine kinase/DNA-binding response OmpR family regulator
MIKALLDNGPVKTSALHSAVRKSLTRVMSRSVAGALLVSGIVGVAGMVSGGLDAETVAIVAATMIGAGAIVGIALVRILAAAIARLAARPVELLLDQPGIVQGLATEPVHWERDQSLTQGQVEEDIEVLHRLLRRASRRSEELIAELNDARETANAQNEAKSQFLAKMSHELRTPLNAILGYATLLHEDATEAGDKSAASDLERIQLAGRHLLRVINDILDLAKIEAGNASIDRQVIDIRELSQTVLLASEVDRHNGNKFEMLVADDVGIMIGDAAKVRQCLTSLLSNAAKFTEQGGITLSIEQSQIAGVPSVVFSVEDTGVGIDEIHLANLFDPFTQIDARASHRAAGMGLGLAISRRLARMMGGDCTVESTEGVGSKFRLVLPLSPPNDVPADEEAESAPVARAHRTGCDKCVLVVDDDEAALDLMRRWLLSMNHDVLVALDGETALKLAREHRPDLILLDALLPGRSGYEILEELRDDPAVGRTPVILVTVDDDRARGIECGASDYLRKPLTEARLRAVLEVYTDNSSGEILVIEDDDDAAELIRRSVEEVGFSTRRATNGREGIEMAAAIQPAGIVLDMRMPELDGFGVIERLALAEGLSKIPVVVLSGYDLSLSQHRRLAAAGYRTYTKGVATPREIAQSLRELVA